MEDHLVQEILEQLKEGAREFKKLSSELSEIRLRSQNELDNIKQYVNKADYDAFKKWQTQTDSQVIADKNEIEALKVSVKTHKKELEDKINLIDKTLTAIHYSKNDLEKRIVKLEKVNNVWIERMLWFGGTLLVILARDFLPKLLNFGGTP